MTNLISKVDVIVTSPARNYVLLKITTEDGVVGWGDATVNGRELAVASYLRDHLAPILVGRDADRIEDTWQYLYRGVYWRRGPINMAAIGAIDLALWDIKGKSLNQPVYQLLGGKVRDRVLAYTHATGWETSELLESVDEVLGRGLRAVRAQSGVPGLSTVYGVTRGIKRYEPAKRDLRPLEEEWDSSAYLRHAPKALAEVRAHIGDEVELLHDAHHRLTPIQAARLGKELEPLHLFWLEDLTPTENQEAFDLIREHTTTPLAVGEVHNTIWDCKDLIINQRIDYVRTCVMHAGGISHVRKIFDLADLYQVKGAPHGPSDVSPLTMAASVQLGMASPAFGMQEYMGYPEQVGTVFSPGYRLVDGYLTASDAPGLGVEIDEDAAREQPYDQAYLPVARTLDGAITNW
ncbi:D-mannonate dehydratase ManD [Propionimicrobium sp. PCR01-08-3]|uniref:D-mannonate dehydratase ManD n=1 Tax=Propionimicrobium sp. PCR01-08-3 TaxID=3052086 RepID=UPI00255CE1DE|nr:D-mannonate dehydratase ManD [Propionimicrobium sp. PCR01-08-3]WIY81741.1 D-galactonate dehydratase family protein [Propionimicrobium sp. PCR01-08-3]